MYVKNCPYPFVLVGRVPQWLRSRTPIVCEWELTHTLILGMPVPLNCQCIGIHGSLVSWSIIRRNHVENIYIIQKFELSQAEEALPPRRWLVSCASRARAGPPWHPQVQLTQHHMGSCPLCRTVGASDSDHGWETKHPTTNLKRKESERRRHKKFLDDDYRLVLSPYKCVLQWLSI